MQNPGGQFAEQRLVEPRPHDPAQYPPVIAALLSSQRSPLYCEALHTQVLPFVLKNGGQHVEILATGNFNTLSITVEFDCT